MADFQDKKEMYLKLVEEHGSSLFIIDHDVIRKNYCNFIKHLHNVQAYYAVKANSNQEIINTLYHQGASFDVASYSEFMQVYTYLKDLEEKDQSSYIWDKIIFSNTVKDKETLGLIKQYHPLMTFDSIYELKKIKDFCPSAGLVVRLKVPDVGSQVEMSSKFGIEPLDAFPLIQQAFDWGLTVEGVSFHVGSQCANFDNYIYALEICSQILNECRQNGYPVNIVDIGGGFPVPYNPLVPEFEKLAELINSECARLFPDDIELIAEPGRYIAGTSAVLVSRIIGKARRDGKIFYHINDGVYHTFSGVVYDHWIPNFQAFKDGESEVCAVVGQTCDSFDKISVSEQLPADLEVGDYLLTENIGAYSIASSTHFNGFPGAKIVHINR
jgi:ornithine decarboxylase